MRTGRDDEGPYEAGRQAPPMLGEGVERGGDDGQEGAHAGCVLYHVVVMVWDPVGWCPRVVL